MTILDYNSMDNQQVFDIFSEYQELCRLSDNKEFDLLVVGLEMLSGKNELRVCWLLDKLYLFCCYLINSYVRWHQFRVFSENISIF